jgi:hypothetical protein
MRESRKSSGLLLDVALLLLALLLLPEVHPLLALTNLSLATANLLLGVALLLRTHRRKGVHDQLGDTQVTPDKSFSGIEANRPSGEQPRGCYLSNAKAVAPRLALPKP